MLKDYFTPNLCPLPALSEGRCRALLAGLLLCPDPSPLTAAALDAYFDLEIRCIAENCRRHLQGIPLQPYRIQPLYLFKELLTAATVPLRASGCQLHSIFEGESGEAIAYPRPLQWAITLLLRCIRHAPQAVACGKMTPDRCFVTIRAASISIDALYDIAVAVLTAHGGCVLRSAGSIGLYFPRHKKAIAPRWVTPSSDSLLSDPLSCINFLRRDPP